MTDFISERMTTLGFALPQDGTALSEELVRDFEQRFGLVLPPDHRAFLVRYAGVQGLAACPMLEPTPFGEEACIDRFYGFEDDELPDATDLLEGAPDVIALGGDPLGKMFWLFCTGPHVGHVVVHDHQGRSAWPDEQFFEWYPALSPEIRRYLDLRREGRLPEKPAGFEHVYLAARSFTQFVERLHSLPDAA